MLCADCAFVLVLPLLLAVLLALNSVQSGSCQSQVPSQPIASVCSLTWSAVDDALVKPAGWHSYCCLMCTIVMVMVPDAPISGFTEFSCAVCRLCEVTRNCVASRGAGDWLIQYSAPRCVKRHVQSSGEARIYQIGLILLPMPP